MKVSVITRHAPSNYGSILQAIATQKAIEKVGHSAEIVDYIREDESGLKGLMMLLSHKKEWNNNIFKKFLYILLRYPGDRYAQYRFSQMRRKYLHLTSRYSTIGELSKSYPIADIYLTGSDQVWGPIATGHYDEAYFWRFLSSSCKKIAFASSFGRTDFTAETMKKYSELLSTYAFIAVRENSAVKLLEDMKVSCKGQVLDPTLLLDLNEWNQLADSEAFCDYVLIYQIHNNPVLDKYAKDFAAHIGLPLIRISPSLHQISRGGRFIFLPTISKFLAYIKNASYIITDSFHGTAFSINFNKQFLEVLPNTKTGSRNVSILQLTGLQDRIVTDYTDFSLYDKKIDYIKVNKILNAERVKSFALLKQMIEDC